MNKNIQPDIDQLSDPAKYRLIKTLNHSEVVQFVVQQLNHLRWPIMLFYIFTAGLLALILALSVYNYLDQIITWGAWSLYLFFGILAGMIMVIPFHEGLHGLAYRLAGAKKVKYGMDLKQLLFYACAPGFVANKKAFLMVAFLPFLAINLCFSAGIAFGNPQVKWASLVALFVHSTMCIGDFAMANFFAAYREKEVYTYDEEETQTSYFYIKT